MRRLSILVALVGGMALSSTAEATTVVIPRIQGLKAKYCRPRIESMLDKDDKRVPNLRFSSTRDPRPPPDYLDRTLAWLNRRSAARPEVRMAVLGARRGASKLRIEVYALPGATLLGLKTFKVGRGCRLSPRRMTLARRWMRRLSTLAGSRVVPAAVASAGVSGSNEAPAGELEDGPGAPRGVDATYSDEVDDEAFETDPTFADEEESAPTANVKPPADGDEGRSAQADGESEDDAPPSDAPDDVPAGDAPPAPAAPPARPASSSEAAGAEVSVVDDAPGARRDPMVAIAVGISITGRDWSFVSPTTPELRNYELSAVPTPWVELEARPLGRARSPWLNGLGVSLALRKSVGLRSVRTEDGASFPTTFTDLRAALQHRWWFSDTGILVPNVSFRKTSFALSTANDGRREARLPGVDYSSLGFGLGLAIDVRPRIQVRGSAAYLLTVGVGKDLAPGRFFDKADVSGFEVTAGVRLHAVGPLSFDLNAALLRYLVEADSERADGARDDMLSMNLAARLAYP